MVTFWKVFHDFANFQLFGPKTAFWVKFIFSMKFSTFRPEISFFAPWPLKRLPAAYVFVGFCAGPAKDPFLGQMTAFWAQNPKKGEIPLILGKMGLPLEMSPWHLKNPKYFLRKTWCFDMSGIMKFLEISNFWEFSGFSWKIAKAFFIFRIIFMFSHPRGRHAQMTVNLM